MSVKMINHVRKKENFPCSKGKPNIYGVHIVCLFL